jgi:alpha-L-fucosidase 2
LNGDQRGGQYSSFTYRPFTLEGNFAFAQGVHELLIQSHDGVIEIFPAVPAKWHDVAFKTLRAEGAFLLSAKKINGSVSEINIYSEHGGLLKIKLPFTRWTVHGIDRSVIELHNGIVEMQTTRGQRISVKNAEQQ